MTVARIVPDGPIAIGDRARLESIRRIGRSKHGGAGPGGAGRDGSTSPRRDPDGSDQEGRAHGLVGIAALAAVGAGVRSWPSPASGSRLAGRSPPSRRPRPLAPAAAPDAERRRSAPASPPGDRRRSASPLVPGQVIQPIDLAGALRLAGARDLDIAIARERVCQARGRAGAGPGPLAAQPLPRPELDPPRRPGPDRPGPGAVDQQELAVPRRRRPRPGRASPARSRRAGPPQVSGLTIDPPDLRRDLRAAGRPAGRRRAPGRRPGRDERRPARRRRGVLRPPAGRRHAGHRPRGRRQRRGPGRASPPPTPGPGRAWRPTTAAASPSATASGRNVEAAVGELEVASAELVRRVRLDPRVVVAPVEPPEAVIRLVADDCPLDDLIATGLRNRPELAEAQALVEATLSGSSRRSSGRSSPAWPSATPGGGFGGGVERLLRQLRRPERRRREPLLGGPEPRLRRPRHRPVSGPPSSATALLELMKVQDRVAVRGRPGRQGPARRRPPDATRPAGPCPRPSRRSTLNLDQHPPRRRPARRDPADRGPPADPGPGPGPGRLPRRRPRLQPRPVSPPLSCRGRGPVRSRRLRPGPRGRMPSLPRPDVGAFSGSFEKFSPRPKSGPMVRLAKDRGEEAPYELSCRKPQDRPGNFERR